MKNFNERDKEMKKSLIALLSATALGTVWANELMKLPANPEESAFRKKICILHKYIDFSV